MESRCAGILIRNPAVDPHFPETSDLDFIVLADIEDMRPQRMRLTAADGATIMIDLTWIPWAWVSDPALACTRGWVPHRLLSSDLVWDSGRGIAEHCCDIAGNMYRSEIQQKRIGVFLDTGYQTVREIGITWDFPGLALFWLQMGHAACLAAQLDGAQRLCPNVYTRPFDYLDGAEARLEYPLRRHWVEALRLDADPEEMISRLRRIHCHIAAKFPEPDWREGMQEGTQFEYRYWLSREELEWRIAVAGEMTRRGEGAAAVYYLRFCAYAIARIPMVHARAAEGRSVSFLRPEKAVLPDLQKSAPEVIDDLNMILSGNKALDQHAIQESISKLNELRGCTVEFLAACGTPVPGFDVWEPYQPQHA